MGPLAGYPRGMEPQKHPSAGAGVPPDWWQEAASRVLAETAAEVRDEAVEVYLAEVARCRLVDRRGAVRLQLRCGVRFIGHLTGRSVAAGHLDLVTPHGAEALIPAGAVLTLTGARLALRGETGEREGSLGAWLRESWLAGDLLRVLDAAGRWHAGTVLAVGADHIELTAPEGAVVIPFAAVEAWQR